MKAAVDVPVTVKLRLGYRGNERNVAEIARLCEEAGASAITIHGRTREARYSKAADWDAIGEVSRAARDPGGGERRHPHGVRSPGSETTLRCDVADAGLEGPSSNPGSSGKFS